MMTFAVAAGPRIPDHTLARLRDPRPDDLAFRASGHTVWSNAAGTVVLAGWQDDVDVGTGSHWQLGASGPTAFAGQLWPRSGSWPRDGSWSARLADHLRAHPLAQGTDDLLGIFAAVSLDDGGRGTVSRDSLSTHPLYRAKVPGASIVSTRLPLTARLAKADRPRRDPIGVGWLAFTGYPIGDRTGFADVEMVPFGARARVGPDGISYELAPAPWQRPPEGDPAALLDELYADIVTSVHHARTSPVPRKIVELTGGKDSRTILAVLLAEGIEHDFEYRTFGGPDLPDVVISTGLAAEYGLPHQVGFDPELMARVVQRRDRAVEAHPGCTRREVVLRMNVGDAAGMRSAHDGGSALAPDGSRVTLNGLYGETLSTNYPAMTRIRNHAGLRRALLAGSGIGSAGILRPAVLERYRNELLASLYAGFDDASAPQDVVDGMYLRQRMRRWFGPTQEADEHNRTFPLHSPVGVRLAWSIGASERHWQWIHRELYRRTVPALADLPFDKGGWPTERIPPRSPEPERPPPLPHHEATRRERATARAEDRRRNRSADLEVMRRYLLDEPSNPVFELVDRDAVDSAITGFADLAEPAREQLYGALSAAIWLGGHEIVLEP